MRWSQSGHIHTWASGPSSTTTDLCPFKSRHHQVLAPPQEAVPLQDWPSRPGGSKGDSRAQTPGKTDSTSRAQEESGEFSIDREEGRPRQAPQGAGHALEGRDRVINGPVT